MSSHLADYIDGTPGRFVPDEMRGELVEAEHLCRYWWAAGLAGKRRVLDAGCGIGYGAAILARAGAAAVTGTDIAEQVVEVARGTAPEGVSFAIGDVRDLPFDDDSFDLVVCFEVIEHVEEQDRCLDELRRVLDRGGVLVVSSPNPEAYVAGNPHHKRELTPRELHEMLASRFSTVELRRQGNFVASAIRRVVEPNVLLDAEPAAEPVHQITSESLAKPTYSIALASDEPLPVARDLITLAAPVDVRAWVERFTAQQEHITGQADALETLRRQLEIKAQLARRLTEAESALAEASELPDLRGRLASVAAELDEVAAELERCRATMRNLETSMSWRVTAPLRSTKQALGAWRERR
jgi:2-polyprenyl-3-methyl-5-hydroxy-6-metoxy-1,4-benzoquinol methylase